MSVSTLVSEASNRTQISAAKALSNNMKSLLCHWYRQRVVRKKSTTALMEKIDNPSDKRALGIVALLDVDSIVMSGLMDAEELQFVQVCHSYLRGRDCGKS